MGFVQHGKQWGKLKLTSVLKKNERGGRGGGQGGGSASKRRGGAMGKGQKGVVEFDA